MRTRLGYVARYCDGRPAGVCCSFLTFGGEVETDVMTLPEFRLRGVGLACCAKFLQECLRRGLTPHWDAQNAQSVALARKLGYEIEERYAAYERP